MNRVSFVGVATGNLIDIASSYVITFLVAFLIAFVYTVTHRQAADLSAVTGSIMFMMASGVLGSLFSIVAGYVSARIAKHDEILNGTLSSVSCVGLNLFAAFSGSVGNHMGLLLALIPLGPALGALGGYLRFRQQS